MLSRRSLFSLSAGFVLAAVTSAQAFEFHPYDPAAVKAAIASGHSVIVHVYAPWCLQCRAQASILDGMKNDPQLDRIKFFRVDYTDQKDVVAALNVPRSTLIGYKGGREVARMSWGTSQEDVVKVIQAAY